MGSSHSRLNECTVFYLCSNDISRVQGNTERYHFATLFDKNAEAYLFGPFENTSKWENTHFHPFTGITGVILLNIFYLPYWGYMALKHEPDIVYCYQNIIIPPFIIRWLTGSIVVYDLRSGPASQASEFSNREDRGIIFELVNVINAYGHKLALRRCDVVITLSEQLKNQLCNSYGLDSDDVAVVPNGVNTDQFTPSQNESEFIRLVYLGTASETRGLEKVAKALDTLHPDLQSNVRFEIYGGGDEKYIESLRPQPDSQWEFIWHGYVDYEEIPDVVSQCDLAVSPLPNYESYEVSSPVKIFEYLSMGLPIIATNIAAHERILQSGENSILVNPDDTTEMASAIERLIRDDQLRDRMGVQARETAFCHDWEARFELAQTIIGGAIARDRQPAQ